MNADTVCRVWTDEIDDVLAGDLVAVLAYRTPAGSVALAPVSPVGVRDRDPGRVGFSTSNGNNRKLERIAADPRVALFFHAREHGKSDRPGTVLLQGTATTDAAMMDRIMQRAGDYLGPPVRGWFWDRWMRVYYRDRIGVWVDISRITFRDAGGNVTGVIGAAPSTEDPPSQDPPAKGTGPRVGCAKTGTLPHRMVGYLDADGMPQVVPVDVTPDGESVTLLPKWPLPAGGRRAGLLGHSFFAKVAGLTMQQHMGWLTVGDTVTYAAHTARRFSLPDNKKLTLFVNGLVARRSSRRGRAAPSPTR